jgi:hypothetical protein
MDFYGGIAVNKTQRYYTPGDCSWSGCGWYRDGWCVGAWYVGGTSTYDCCHIYQSKVVITEPYSCTSDRRAIGSATFYIYGANPVGNYSRNRSAKIYTLTDENGYYIFQDINNGEYSISASKEGYTPCSLELKNVTVYCRNAQADLCLSSNIPPVAYIDSITPSPAVEGDAVSFTGHGEDEDGSVVAYDWRSSIDGFLSDQASFSASSLSVGNHTIYFKVQDDDGAWSEEVSASLEVEEATAVLQVYVIDKALFEVGEEKGIPWASVSIDGMHYSTDYWGKTEEIELSPGSYTVSASHRFYNQTTTTIELRPGERIIPFVVLLEPEYPTIKINAYNIAHFASIWALIEQPLKGSIIITPEAIKNRAL